MVLRTSDYLIEFLKESNDEAYMRTYNRMLQEQGPKKIYDINTI